MSFNVVILKAAKADLKEIRDYVIARFSESVWLSTSKQLRSVIHLLAMSPHAGAVPGELEMLNSNDYRQVISGMNRIIYEVRQDMVYVHAVVDVRRDMASLLTKRLLRSSI